MYLDKAYIYIYSIRMSRQSLVQETRFELAFFLPTILKIGVSDKDDLDESDDDSGPKRWSPEEDDKLKEAVRDFGEINWKAIANRVATRNHVQCLQRWKKVLKPGLVKGQWSAQEDAMLVTLVSEGFKNWGQLAQHMPGRTSKQCRERWCHHLDPSIKKGDYTEEEDRTIMDMQAKLGNKWAQIAQLLPGRTENAVKIRWKAIDRSRKNNKSNGHAQIRSRNTPDSRLRSLAARAAALAMSKAQMNNGSNPAGFPQDPMLINRLMQMQQVQQAQATQAMLNAQYMQSYPILPRGQPPSMPGVSDMSSASLTDSAAQSTSTTGSSSSRSLLDLPNMPSYGLTPLESSLLLFQSRNGMPTSRPTSFSMNEPNPQQSLQSLMALTPSLGQSGSNASSTTSTSHALSGVLPTSQLFNSSLASSYPGFLST